MPTNFEKAQLLAKQAARETDPVLRKLALKRVNQYYKVDLKGENQRLRHAKPQYALSRVIFAIGVLAVLVLLAVVSLSHQYREVNMLTAIPAAMLIVGVVALIALFVLGKLSERGFLDGIQFLLGKENKGNDSRVPDEPCPDISAEGKDNLEPEQNAEPE